jgi:hypothetical protein
MALAHAATSTSRLAPIGETTAALLMRMSTGVEGVTHVFEESIDGDLLGNGAPGDPAARLNLPLCGFNLLAVRDTTTTNVPPAARRTAIARPIPRPPPVTRANRASKGRSLTELLSR